MVSIIIPSYNRSNLIELTLKSLVEQDYDHTKFEIVVVDNASTDNTADVVKKWVALYPDLIKYEYESRQGSHYARNGVVRNVNGDLLYFTDDDMIADKRMLSSLVRVMEEHPEVATATGRVIPHWEKEPPMWLKKFFVNGWLSLYDREDDFYLSDDDFGVFSCHQIVRKDLFIRAGGYNPDIVDGDWLGDNETGLNIKLKALGGKFAFVHSSVTEHVIPPHRMTQTYFNKRFANQGNCDSYTEYRAFRFSETDIKEKILTYKRLILIKWAKCLSLWVIRNPKWHVQRAWVEYYKNRIKYDKRIISDEDWRALVLKDNWID